MDISIVSGGRKMKLFSKFIKPLCLCKAVKIADHAGPYLKGHVLDLGAGRCYIAKEIKDRYNLKVTCVDIDDLNETQDIKLIVYDGKNLPFKNNAFDTVLIVYVLHHCTDPIEALKECRRVCKKGGRVIIFEDFGPVMYTHAIDWIANKLIHNVEAPLNFKTHEEWKRIFDKLGLEIVHVEDGVEKQVFYPFIKHSMFVLKVNK